MITTSAYAANEPGALLHRVKIERRQPGPHEVLIDIDYCGICHTDIHMARGDFPGQVFPLVPGHEIVGRVQQIGEDVRGHSVGDIVGVGCLIDSCRSCDECVSEQEQFCDKRISTYGRYEKDGFTPAYGGYSTHITVASEFVLNIAPSLQPAAAAPLLCAGITTYSPLRHWNVDAHSRVGVVGLGGLGHLAVKLAAAMGAEVTVLSTSESKRSDALRLGATDFLYTRDPEAFSRNSGRFDLILSTVSAALDYDAYLRLLKRDGTLVLLGVSDSPITVSGFSLLPRRKSIAASPIGGIRETQEMLDFCADHQIGSDIELIAIGDVNAAYERVLHSDVRYRFVIDMNSLR
ncbi:NAD(P)-dependent alcohol dehydrogenase [[Mycobacterium] vasticus]|uniref:alcohol dehydrogenase (NADP(+)) n=1 Tax=[Mycobacterium] vasticus TaxID=2875777 RepID=A0ABU5Z4D3_9MYCO|nr:NAD(P)-dependent alcohol dehydrogenase [Mycolicibacter sp. MYC017]MEB3071474.1 NAD(P)-dependent alcohol dehydrogenase [Mycolicibacter sp. MYC017]